MHINNSMMTFYRRRFNRRQTLAWNEAHWLPDRMPLLAMEMVSWTARVPIMTLRCWLTRASPNQAVGKRHVVLDFGRSGWPRSNEAP
jgi:hypothetical protein